MRRAPIHVWQGRVTIGDGWVSIRFRHQLIELFGDEVPSTGLL